MKIGFIGLGTMGLPMAANLLKAGYELVVYNRSRGKVEDFLKQKGVEEASSPGEVARRAEVVFTMLSNDEVVEMIYFGQGGIVEAVSNAKSDGTPCALRIAIDSSTISPQTSIRVGERLSAIGVEMLDAPVTGSSPQAIEGVLTFMVGGKAEIFEECQPLFMTMAKKAVRMGESGTGSYAKLANNSIVAINLMGLSEALTMVCKSGINPELFLDVISGGGARSAMAEMKAPKMLDRDFSAQFMVQLMHKDLKLALRLAETLQMPAPMLASALQQFQVASSSGLGAEDMSAVVKIYEEWAGVEVKRQ